MYSSQTQSQTDTVTALPFWLRLWVPWSVLLWLVMQTPTLGKLDSGDADFETQVWPILERHCLQCHHENRAEGDLVFDGGRQAVVQGGHTGRPILGPSASESELIRRINSTQPGYRMPKEGPPLDTAQIATLTAWVDQGAAWPDRRQPDQPIAPDQSNTGGDPWSDSNSTFSAADAWVWFDDQMQTASFRQGLYLWIACLLTVAGLLVLRRRSVPQWSRGSFLHTIVAVMLAFLCAGTYVHYNAKYDAVVAEFESVRAELMTYTGPPHFANSLEVPYPMHPARLGGVYYRGNDERDARLFNGGFYRTATLEVWLTDSMGTHLKVGDVVDGPLYIDFIIKRAANTTGELFSDDIMSVIGLCSDVKVNEDGLQGKNSRSLSNTTVGKVVPMTSEVPGQQWKSRFRINTAIQQDRDAAAGSPLVGDTTSTTGKLYVVQNTSRPKVHYGIEFEIQTNKDGRITNSSQLWMGSVYNLNGRVFVPYDGQKILLDRWFDFRPIPEITGPQTDDPELLGVPEHRGTK